MQISRLLTGRREDKMSVDITQFIEPPEEYMQASAFADQMLLSIDLGMVKAYQHEKLCKKDTAVS